MLKDDKYAVDARGFTGMLEGDVVGTQQKTRLDFIEKVKAADDKLDAGLAASPADAAVTMQGLREGRAIAEAQTRRHRRGRSAAIWWG